ncbi:BamA/TamA family outer membrane protein [Persicobacter sp. CCB-QB2]|uniref:BamA/TamA family outer membrane protein n=1 Tax=Persicobacter sp. CCB-QB2 TaxID=1561025 RepID=UPI0006A9E552|nr:BamA/TamA family outer membrane protein [Persicobacter sp. CCB-QB2]
MSRNLNPRLGLIALFLCLCSTISFAEKKKEQKKEKNHSILPLPVIYYSPETKLAFGGLVFNLFHMEPEDTLTQTSYVRSAFIYTLNNQYLFEVDNALFFRDDRMRMKNYFILRSYPDFFYGIGQDIVAEDDKEQIAFFDLKYRASFLFRIAENMYLGPRYQLYSAMDIDLPEESMIRDMELTGYGGYTSSGLGLAFQWDTRDNVLNATSGHLIELETEHNMGLLRSSFRYDWMGLDMRYFHRLHPSGVLALHYRGEFTTGEVPFESLAKMGSSEIMRGYFKGKYRDKVTMATQVEYRQHIWWRIGMVAFAGVGDVSSSLGEFTINHLKWSYGAGLRFRVKDDENLNIRLDYGLGNDGNSGFYIEIAEAF